MEIHAHCRLILNDVNQLLINHSLWLDEGSVYAFICSIAKRCTKRAVVIDPYFTAALDNKELETATAANLRCYTTGANDWELAVIIVMYPGHFALATHDRSENTINYYDPFPVKNNKSRKVFFTLKKYFRTRLTHKMEKRVQKAVKDVGGVPNLPVNIIRPGRQTYNDQTDTINCGIHACLIAEAFLMQLDMYIENIDIQAERRRILNHVLALFGGDDCRYDKPNRARTSTVAEVIATEATNVLSAVETTIADDASFGNDSLTTAMAVIDVNEAAVVVEDEGGVEAASLTAVDSPAVNVALPFTIVLRPRNTATATNNVTVDVVVKETPRCYASHRGVGCAAVSANHMPAYYDSGKFGDKVCQYCGALLLNSETSAKCCSEGKVALPAWPAIPEPLLSYRSHGRETPEAIEFQRHAKEYNNLLSFACLQVGQTNPAGRGPPVCLLNGDFRHMVGDLIPPNGEIPKFLSLYFIDAERALEARLDNARLINQVHEFDADMLVQLDAMLREGHPMGQSCMYMKEMYERALVEREGQPVTHVRLTLLNERDVPNELRDPTLHSRQVNAPTGDTMCALWVSNTDEPIRRSGIHIYERTGRLKPIGLYSEWVDTCTYSLLFPSGESGYVSGILLANARNVAVATTIDDPERVTANEIDFDAVDEGVVTDAIIPRRCVSCRQFYMYRLQLRGSLNEMHHVFNLGRLTQTYIIDASFKVDQQVAEHTERAFREKRITHSDALLKYLARNLEPNERLGSVLIAPSSFKGGRAFYKKKFYDTTTLFRAKGQPQFFLTFTSDPKWPEVKDVLKPGESTVDAPHILTRIWIDKSRKLQNDVEHRNIFGKCVAFMEALEFQKRGGPHSHKLITIDDLLGTAANVDLYICAEIPPMPEASRTDARAGEQRRLRQLVIEKQLHTCNDHCMVEGRCSKHFPKTFCDETVVHEDKPCQYRRRSPQNGGESHAIRKGTGGYTYFIQYDNSHVVPYNPYILLKYACHHNVEWVYGKEGIKYACKYPLKGPEYQYIRVANDSNTVNYNEFNMIFKANYRSGMEAFMRMYGYPIVRMSHAVHLLPIHLPNEAPQVFEEGEEEALVEAHLRGDVRKTKLTAFFELCAANPERHRHLFYIEVVHDYWYTKDGWRERQRRLDVVSRMQCIPPRYQEQFALRLLLLHVSGPKSYADLKIHNGVRYASFIETARAMGLMQDDDVWKRTLLEAKDNFTPREMRGLFVQILLYGIPSDAPALWNEFLDQFFDHRNVTNAVERERRISKALQLIQRQLSYNGRCCADFGLPTPFVERTDDTDQDRLDNLYFPGHLADDEGDETAMPPNQAPTFYNRLNAEQKVVVDKIERAVEGVANAATYRGRRLFFLTGSGGTGKTYVYNTLIHRCISRRKYVLATASTGIAATLLFNGSTVHSTFSVPLEVDENTVPSVPAESWTARVVRNAQLIIIDEVTMLHRFVLHTIDRLMRYVVLDEASRNLPFGGKVVLLGGDWKQLLPVVTGRDSGMLGQITASVKKSDLYPLFEKLNLSQNMRVTAEETEFREWLEKVGKGLNYIDGTNRIAIESNMQASTLRELLNFVFEDGRAFSRPNELCDKLILAPLNRQVDRINDDVIALLPGEAKLYLSADTPLQDYTHDVYAAFHDVEYLNSTTPSGFPPHRLLLKVNTVVVLLRNINVRQGLCNGTRLLVETLGENLIHCRILTGNATRSGTRVVLSQFSFDYKDERPEGTRMHFRRRQFPLKPAFCMTINKAQGQTVEKLGIALESEMFSAGQMYVALSRVRKRSAVKIFINVDPAPDPAGSIRNIVARDVVD